MLLVDCLCDLDVIVYFGLLFICFLFGYGRLGASFCFTMLSLVLCFSWFGLWFSCALVSLRLGYVGVLVGYFVVVLDYLP